MDTSCFPMAKSTEPNPLRPYYIPPTIGTASSSHSAAAAAAANSSSPSSSFARELLPDLDLASTGSEAWQVTRSLLDTLAWRYTSTLLAQPFDVAKTLLQVQVSGGEVEDVVKKVVHPNRTRGYSTDEHARSDETEDETSDEDEMPDYFSQTAPTPKTRSDSTPRRTRRRKPSTKPSSKSRHISSSPSPNPSSSSPSHPRHSLRITKPASVMHAVSQLYSTSGAVGLWRASNTTFLYSILVRTTDTFIRSLLLAILGLPDIAGPSTSGLSPGLTTPLAAGFSGIDLSDSPNPVGSLIVIAISSSLTGLFLLPLDMVRTRLILTPIDRSPRGLLQNLRRLPSLLAPSILYLPTALYHSIPNTFSAAIPLFLRRNLSLTPESSPSLWSLAAFATTLTELFIRLPLETVVRRAQVAVLKKEEPDLPMIVTPGAYKGVWGTVYHILYVEGERSEKGREGMIRMRKGQGVHGLVRGWRIGFWGLVGVWGAGALGAEGKGREF